MISMTGPTRGNEAFRRTLFEHLLLSMPSPGLSEWLRYLEQDPKGNVEEKRARIRQHSKYLSMSPDTYLQQTTHNLTKYNVYMLTDLCKQLGLSADGAKDQLFRCIYREIGYREGWLTKPAKPSHILHVADVWPFVQWYPILKKHPYEKDYYDEFFDEMVEVFGTGAVHKQLAVANGNSLKIDFHIGHPQRAGVGVEFKMPKNNGEIQKALGQIDQYKARYGSDLIVVLLPDFLDQAKMTSFVEPLTRKQITVVVKTRVTDGDRRGP